MTSQPSGRLSNAQPTNRTETIKQPFRKAKIPVSQRESSGRHLFSLRANNQLNQHLMEIEEQAQERMETLMESIISETLSTKQGKISDGMGTTHELVEDDGRGNHSQGDHLQLDLEFNKTMKVVKKKRLCHLLI